MKKLFIAAMALATIVSCSKDDGDAVLTSGLKSVSIKIENAATATRNGGDTAEGSNTACAVASDLVVWFADGSGNILQEFQLGNPVTGTTNEYMFHRVSEQVQNIAVGRYEDKDVTPVGSTIASIIALAEDPQAGNGVKNIARPISEIILSSDMVKLQPNGETCTDTTIDGKTYESPIYEANVTVAPRLSRVEILKIQCDDLGALNEDDDEESYGFDELTLNSFVFGDNTLTAINGTVLSGSYAAKGADGKWAEVTGDPANSVEPEKGAWSWNLEDGQAFETMELYVTGDAKDWIVNNGDTKLVINSLSAGTPKPGTHATDCTCGIVDGKVATYEANHIYKMNIIFGEGDMEPRNAAICVNVTVDIVDWVVVPVTPNFGAN